MGPFRTPSSLLPNVNRLRWYFFTRGLGVLLLAYGLLIDKSGDRGTIILTGAGFVGLDRVARNDPKGHDE